MTYTLLPGQKLINGTSNFLFGTNMGGDGTSATRLRNTPAIQSEVKAGNFQIMRAFIPANKPTSYFTETLNTAQACGCQLYILLDGTNVSWNQTVINFFGTNCMLYEVGNEPNTSAHNINGVTMTGTDYYNLWWHPQIATLRNTAPAGAAFIGPTITYRLHTLDGQFITDWLTLCQAAGGADIPDGVSHHHYVCDGQNTEALCAPLATIFSSDFSIVDTAVQGALGKSLPVILSEWSIAGGSPPPAYTQDFAFASTWVHTAIDTMVKAGYAGAMQFEGGSGEGGKLANGAGGLDLIYSVPPFSFGPLYQPIVDKANQYLKAPVSIPIPPPTPASDPFGNAGDALQGTPMYAQNAPEILSMGNYRPPSLLQVFEMEIEKLIAFIKNGFGF